jgi:hypothetical protein
MGVRASLDGAGLHNVISSADCSGRRETGVAGIFKAIRQVPIAALGLGLAGALPFIAGALLTAQRGGAGAWGALFLIFYGAVILSFLGGVHWGSAMAQGEPGLERLGASVLPALVAWLALAISGPLGFIILAVAFALLLAYDLVATRERRAPAWYPALRWPLTLVAIACLLLAAATTDLW